MEALHSQGAAGVGLGPAGPQGSEGVGVLDIVVEEVATGPLVELDGVKVWRLLIFDEFIDGDQSAALFSSAVKLRLSADFDGLERWKCEFLYFGSEKLAPHTS